MTDKEKILAEIKRKQEEEYICDSWEEDVGYYGALDALEDFINSLPAEPQINDLWEEALNQYGIISQQWVLVEECGELLNAIAKSKRGRANKEDIITELADVSIIVEQMAFFYGMQEFIEERKRKLLRLKERLKIKEELK